MSSLIGGHNMWGVRGTIGSGEDFCLLLYLERSGKLKNFLLSKENFNRIKLIATISFRK